MLMKKKEVMMVLTCHLNANKKKQVEVVVLLAHYVNIKKKNVIVIIGDLQLFGDFKCFCFQHLSFFFLCKDKRHAP